MRGKVLENTRSKEELLKNLLRHSGAKKKEKKVVCTHASAAPAQQKHLFT